MIFKSLRKLTATALLLAALLAFALPSAEAAPPQYGAGSSCPLVIPFHLSGQYTATATGVVKFTAPYKMTLDMVQANARASGGTSPTLTVDLLKAAVSVLSAPISITAGTVATGTITTAAFAADDVVTVNLAITGTSPTWNDITVVLVGCRQ